MKSFEKVNLTFTRELPKEEGYYWWTDFGEHTPCVLEVTKQDGKWYAQNEEFCFQIRKVKPKQVEKENKEVGLDKNKDGFYHGEELWCKIPNPYLPTGKQVEPDIY